MSTRLLVLFGVFLILCNGVSGATQSLNPATDPTKISVVFRLDDPSSTSDWDAETRIVELFKKKEVPITLSVVPFSNGRALEGERAAILREWVADEAVEVALHGYAHTNRSATDLSTEFADVDTNEQRRMLSEGKEHLEAIIKTPIDVFVPPYNSYDSNTLRNLENLGFGTISASLEAVAQDQTTLRFLPYTTLSSEYYDSVKVARGLAKDNIATAIVVLIHSYEFTDGPVTPAIYGGIHSFAYQELEKLLAWTARQPDIQTGTIKEVAAGLRSAESSEYLRQSINYAKYHSKYEWLFGLRNFVLPWTKLTPPGRDHLGYGLTYPIRFDTRESLMDYGAAVLAVMAIPLAVYSVLWLLGVCVTLPALVFFGHGLVLRSLIKAVLVGLGVFSLVLVSLAIFQGLGYWWIALISVATGILTGCLAILPPIVT